MKHKHITVSEETHERLIIQKAKERRPMWAIADEALREYFTRHNAKEYISEEINDAAE